MTAENHYVIIVHGTFNTPTEGQPPLWYQPGGAFVKNYKRNEMVEELLADLLAGEHGGYDLSAFGLRKYRSTIVHVRPWLNSWSTSANTLAPVLL